MTHLLLDKVHIPYSSYLCVSSALSSTYTVRYRNGQVSLCGYILQAHYATVGIVSKTEKNILPEHCKTDLLLQFIIKQISVLTHIVRHFLSLRDFSVLRSPTVLFPY